jgi:hypothetical protein
MLKNSMQSKGRSDYATTLLTSIQRSAWKGYSANFAGTRNGATPHKKRAGRLAPALGLAF